MKNCKFLIIFSLCLFLSSCSLVEPNHEGVLMENYGKAGKSDFSIQSGQVWTIAPGTELYEVPMFEQKGDCPTLDVYAKDGGLFKVDPSYTYSPIRGKGVDILFAYKHLYGSSKTFYDNVESSILNTRVLNAYREESRKFSTDSLMNNVAKYESAVQARLLDEFNTKYFQLSEVTSNLTPPASMASAIESRNNQIQEANKLKNAKQTRETQIEIDIMNAESRVKVAELDAKAKAIRNQTLTSVALKELELQRWNGAYPSTVLGSNTGIMLNR